MVWSNVCSEYISSYPWWWEDQGNGAVGDRQVKLPLQSQQIHKVEVSQGKFSGTNGLPSAGMGRSAPAFPGVLPARDWIPLLQLCPCMSTRGHLGKYTFGLLTKLQLAFSSGHIMGDLQVLEAGV